MAASPPVPALQLFDRFEGHEQVVLASDPDTGLRAIIALHSTALGPALGGTRFHAYPDDASALDDVLQLAKAMSYKNALAGLPHGGGKAVILGDPHSVKTDALLEAYGRAVDVARRPLLHRLRRRVRTSPTWMSSPAPPSTSPDAAKPRAAAATRHCSRLSASSAASAPAPSTAGALTTSPVGARRSPGWARSDTVW